MSGAGENTLSPYLNTQILLWAMLWAVWWWGSKVEALPWVTASL